MGEKNPKFDGFFRKSKKWREPLEKMREIALDTPLNEEMKWRNPCYTLDGTNIVLIHEFKEYCAFLFFKGALLYDPKGLLIQPTANMQAARQARFTNETDVKKAAPALKKLIQQAIKNEKAGLKVELKKTTEFAVPDEFKERLDNNAKLKKAFESLTPGRQRAYLLHFAGAKQSKTRESRIDKWTPQILAGKGLDD